MRIFVPPATDIFDAKRRAKQFLQCLSEYGCAPKMSGDKYIDGPDFIEVSLPTGMHQTDLNEMLAALGAHGVTVQKEDVNALVHDPVARQGVAQLVEKKLVNASEIPVEDVSSTVRQWTDSLWLDASELTEEQEREAYEQVVNTLPSNDDIFNHESAPTSGSGLRELIDDADTWLEQHKAENPGSSYEASRWSVR